MNESETVFIVINRMFACELNNQISRCVSEIIMVTKFDHLRTGRPFGQPDFRLSVYFDR